VGALYTDSTESQLEEEEEAAQRASAQSCDDGLPYSKVRGPSGRARALLAKAVAPSLNLDEERAEGSPP